MVSRNDLISLGKLRMQDHHQQPSMYNRWSALGIPVYRIYDGPHQSYSTSSAIRADASQLIGCPTTDDADIEMCALCRASNFTKRCPTAEFDSSTTTRQAHIALGLESRCTMLTLQLLHSS